MWEIPEVVASFVVVSFANTHESIERVTANTCFDAGGICSRRILWHGHGILRRLVDGLILAEVCPQCTSFERLEHFIAVDKPAWCSSVNPHVLIGDSGIARETIRARRRQSPEVVIRIRS